MVRGLLSYLLKTIYKGGKMSEEVKDPQAGLTDQEFACLLMRSCGVSNLVGALGYVHANECGFCDGSKQVDQGRRDRYGSR